MVAKKTSVFLFPGQGAQYPLMGIDLFEASDKVRELFKKAGEAAGRNMEKTLREASAEELKRTDLSQPTITLVNLAAASLLRERGVDPVACAGFSLGEYAALALAGVISEEDCFRLVAARGVAMQKAADKIAALGQDGAAPGMAAVLGLAPNVVEQLIAEWKDDGVTGLYAANFNSPRQTVVSGTAAALDEAEKRFKAAGARRVLRLNVAGPFHSPLVAEAADEFAPILESADFSDPTCPFFSNVTGAQVSTGEEAKKLALRQITESVRWTTEEDAVARVATAAGATTVLEVGPGKVLQGLWNDSGIAMACRAAGTVADIDSAVAAL